MSADVADILGAGITSRGLRTADISAKIHKSVAGVCLCLGRNGISKDPFNLYRITQLLGIKAEAAADTDTMRIRDYSGYPVDVAQK